MILPPATLGMLGGGQLGRFFVAAAHEMGYFVRVLDPDPHSPAGLIADRHLVAAYDDYAALDELAQGCAAISTEFENVPAGTLDYLDKFVVVRPSAAAVSVCQNRIAEKNFLREHGLPHADFAAVHCEQDLREASDSLFPGILKVARFGYDGKGQAVVADRDQALAAFQHFKGEICVLEQKLMLERELSVVLARDEVGGIASFPTVENSHRKGILDVSLGAGASFRRFARARHRTGRADRRTPWLYRHPGGRVLRRGRRNWSSTKWHRGRTTAATTRSTPASPASSNSRCAPCAACRSAMRARTRPRQWSICSVTCGTKRPHRASPSRTRLVEAVRLSRPQAPPVWQASRPAGRKMGHFTVLDTDPDRGTRWPMAARAAIGITDVP
jgi:5-(carboxyamino)imidazole ribonucleotide synthase